MVYFIWKLICFLLISKKLKHLLGFPDRPWALSLLGLMDKAASSSQKFLTGGIPPHPLT